MYAVKLIILGLLLISISPASAWWNTDWENRREIQINNTLGSELTYYQVYINLSDNPINSTSLRIVNETAGTIVPHWQEIISSENCTGLWFNTTSIPTLAWLNETYYMYYGNEEIASDRDIGATFIYGDDFENGDGSWVNSASNPISSTQAYRGTNSRSVESGTKTYLSVTLPDAFIVEYDYRQGAHTTSGAQLRLDNGASDLFLPAFGSCAGADQISYLSSAPAWVGIHTYSVDTWYKIRYVYDITGHASLPFQIWVDDVLRADWMTTFYGTTKPTRFSMHTAYGSQLGYFDSFRIRKYATNPPTYVLGTEETVFFIPPGPVNLQHIKGFFWVNHTWDAGTGNVTDSYNISHNGSWINNSSNTYYNSGDIGDGGYSEILIYAYNNSGFFGFLSEEYVTQNISAPPYIPPPAPINLQYTKGEYWVNHTWDEGLGGFTNSYNISHNESWTNGSSNTYFNSGGVGRNGMSTIIVYAYNGILSEEYIIQTISTKPGIGYDQKISDSNIQLFFFPVMFFLLIMIFVGGFKYVYK